MANTRAIVDLQIFRTNIANIRSQLHAHTKICLAVKADAYGHGAQKISETAIQSGVEWLAVATADEALDLRNGNIRAPILLLGHAPDDSAEELIRHGISCVVGDLEHTKIFASAAKHVGITARLHLEIDTGMGRTGCHPERASAIASFISDETRLELEGVFTHFADAEGDESFTRIQIERFEASIDSIKCENKPMIHASNSAGVFNVGDARYDMVRPGISAYGYSPNGIQAPVTPVMELVSKVVFVKEVADKTPISYGMTYKTAAATRIATISAGYADGYPRLLSNRGHVEIRGCRYPVVGTVCMDQFMVDLGADSPVQTGDDVRLIGRGDDVPDASDIAEQIGTISYEILCGVGKRVPRIYVG